MPLPKTIDEKLISVDGDLNDLLKRLEPGMVLNGRIVDCLGDDKYILRIWGYNVLTQSHYSFQRFDEIELVVKKVQPEFELVLQPAGHNRAGKAARSGAGGDVSIIVF
ncbi:MAG: hypothetical protein ABIA75_01610 [Candidatus Neomarinimicrobiota bacterium]